jgi:hypothetical protein
MSQAVDLLGIFGISCWVPVLGMFALAVKEGENKRLRISALQVPDRLRTVFRFARE